MGQTIRSVDWKSASEVLGGEASHFTPWLSENLELLGASLGIEELELQSTELDVQGKRLDVLAATGAEVDGKTVGVAIENQYGATDHSHLGQLVTYIAGVATSYDRVLGVWLVDSIHPAHQAAVELLNRETSDRVGFVLARPRFIELGDGSYGVDFDVAVRPNEFIRAERLRVKSTNAERSEFLFRVMSIAEADLRAAGFPSVAKPSNRYSADVSWGDGRWRINVRVSKPDDGFRAMIYVNGFDTTEENEALLHEITAHEDVLRAELTSPHDFVVDSHLGNPHAKKAALATCFWPDWGYRRDPAESAARLVEFGRGVAAAVKAAGH